MVKLNYTGKNIYITNAAKKANQILSSDEFYNRIAVTPQLDNTELSSAEIARIMKEANQQININTYWWPWGANAGTVEAYRFKVNTARISSILHIAVNTLVHETVHAIDYLDGKLNFTHYDNNPDNEDNTAPWKIGEIAEGMASQS